MDEISKSSGLGTRATLIKFCVKVFLDDFEARGEKALPRAWREIVEALDNRKTASRGEFGKNVFRVAEGNGGTYGSKKPRRKK